MPTYKLPKVKAKKNTHAEVAVDSEWVRHINSIPVSKDMVGDLEVGSEFEVLLRGTIRGVESFDSVRGDSRHSFDLDLDSVSVYPKSDNEFEELSKDD